VSYLSEMQRVLRGEAPAPPIAATIGMRLSEVSEGRAVFLLDARMDRHANPMGTLHGGILCDVADAAMGTACASRLGDGQSFTTLELKINFLRPAWDGTLRAEARVVKAGRTVGLVECDVTDAQGLLVARASSTCMTLPGDVTRERTT
jgi:uncharacterized protein (TIGR00369 family)